MKAAKLPAARNAPAPIPQAARARIAIGNASAEAEVAVTPAGLIAIGGMVSLILLSVAPIILSAAVVRRARKG